MIGPGRRHATAEVVATEVLYLSTVPSPSQFQAMNAALKPGAQQVTYGMPESGYKFHTLIQRGMVEGAGCRIHSIVGRSATPVFHRGGYWSRVVERVAPGRVVDHRGFPNVRGLKQLWLAASLMLAALRWRVRTRSSADRVLVADAAYITALPGVLLACRGGGIRRVAIFADVYSSMADVSDASERRSSLLHVVARRVMPWVYRGVDGFVLLTEHMNPVVNPDGRPHMVMEGLVDRDMGSAANEISDKTAEPTVLYAGALRAEYGLADLVQGFRDWNRPDARLVIYGGGDYADDIALAAAADTRIDFRGTAATEEVVLEEQRAWLLVNPRPVDADFTRFSFPSKNMEYLASGTAVLTTRLPGIPDEYYRYVLAVDGAGPAGITAALERAFAAPLSSLHERGLTGKDFVLRCKNNDAQARRIIEFAKGLPDDAVGRR